MHLSDFIGYFFVFIALIYLFAKKKIDEEKMKKAVKPSSVPTMQVVKQKVRPGKQPKPVAKALVPQQNDLVKPAEHYEVIRVTHQSRGSSILNRLKAKRDMVIIKEIFDKPLSMRNEK
ncbi:MAG: hypothetical protein WCG42_02885 [Parachlamydiaceae bacterium]